MTLYRQRASTPQGRRGLNAARLRYGFLVALTREMREASVTTNDLADRLGLTEAKVRSVLNGTGNVTITTLAEYFDALGLQVEFKLSPVVSRKDREKFNSE